MKRSLHHGLIVCPSASDSGPFHEFASRCGWPVLLRPELRTLVHELTTTVPRRLVFWLEWEHDVDRVKWLTAWVRQRDPQVERIILAYAIDARFESCLRAAGAHCYWPLSNESPGTIEQALRIVLRGRPQLVSAHAHCSAGGAESSRSSLQVGSELIRPP